MVKRSRKQRPRNARRAALLRRLKAKNHLSIDKIATCIGISSGLMSSYLDGEEMFLSDAVCLSVLFDITLDELACADVPELPRREPYITKC